MTPLHKFIILGAIAAMLGGCSTLNSLTGQTDDTVLPGQREEAIPGRAQFPERADVPQETASGQTGQSSAGDTTASTCPAGDPSCAPPTGDDTFSDPQ